jgi:3-hydroxyacyl-[acyl-carrier-protein] dehydratase
VRYILLDRITELEAGRRLIGIKNVTMSDSLMRSYRPDLAALPATFVLEAMAQGAGALLIASVEFRAQPVLAKVQGFRAFAQARPGDQIVISAELQQMRTAGCKASVRAKVEDRLLAEANIYLALVGFDDGRRSEDLRAQMANLFPEWFSASTCAEVAL